MKFTVLLLAVLLPSPLLAQGLGDTAARERQKREEKKAAAPAKVFTDADLPAAVVPGEGAGQDAAAPSGAAVIPTDSDASETEAKPRAGDPAGERGGSAVPVDPSLPDPNGAPRDDRALSTGTLGADSAGTGAAGRSSSVKTFGGDAGVFSARFWRSRAAVSPRPWARSEAGARTRSSHSVIFMARAPGDRPRTSARGPGSGWPSR